MTIPRTHSTTTSTTDLSAGQEKEHLQSDSSATDNRPPTDAENAASTDSPDVFVRKYRGWSWLAICAAAYSSAFLYGLDTTIVANIQPFAVERFGDVEKLGWLGIGFPLGSVATILSFSKAFGMFDVKWYRCLEPRSPSDVMRWLTDEQALRCQSLHVRSRLRSLRRCAEHECVDRRSCLGRCGRRGHVPGCFEHPYPQYRHQRAPSIYESHRLLLGLGLYTWTSHRRSFRGFSGDVEMGKYKFRRLLKKSSTLLTGFLH